MAAATFCEILIAILLPPLGVFLKYSCGVSINISKPFIWFRSLLHIRNMRLLTSSRKHSHLLYSACCWFSSAYALCVDLLAAWVLDLFDPDHLGIYSRDLVRALRPVGVSSWTSEAPRLFAGRCNLMYDSCSRMFLVGVYTFEHVKWSSRMRRTWGRCVCCVHRVAMSCFVETCFAFWNKQFNPLE